MSTSHAGTRPLQVAVIGAGPGGICTGIRLREAGIDDFVILEKAGGVGGTWWHNRYPGAACDVQSHLYSFSFEPKLDWTRPYATQPEIQRYLEHCVAAYGLAPHLRLGTEVVAACWDEGGALWRLRTGGGDEVLATCVVGATGMFNELAWPDIPGLDTFAGTVFHSARWDHSHDLTGERVGVIGSAASAVQFVPAIAPTVGRLHVFQRTANWVMPKADEPFTDVQLRAFRDDPMAARRLRWELWRALDRFITFDDPQALEGAEAAAREKLEEVADPDVRARLTPDHPVGCKRPLIADDYYVTFNRPNVELVTDAIREVAADGIVTADGTRRALDTIVAATGFRTTRYLAAIDVTGRDGRRLEDAWSEGAQAYLGITTAGFPNLFMLYGPNTNNGSIIFMLECQVAYIVRTLERMRAEGLAWVDVKPGVMASYNAELQRDLDAVGVWQASCSNYYRGPSGRIVTQWPHTMIEYQARTLRPDPGAYEVALAGPER